MFEINSKIVCVDGRFPSAYIRSQFPALPRKGHIYTVRDIVPGQERNLKPTVAVLLHEIVSPPNQHGIEPGFAPWRFADMNEVQQAAKVSEHLSMGTYTAALCAPTSLPETSRECGQAEPPPATFPTITGKVDANGAGGGREKPAPLTRTQKPCQSAGVV